MSQVDLYLDAAERDNTRRSYASAIRHFEIEWRGLLPATIDSIARYLDEHAESLTLNTLKHRLAALSRWHQEHGFPDPTTAAKLRQVLKGIRAPHSAQEKRAKPLELEILQQTNDRLVQAAAAAVIRGDAGSSHSLRRGFAQGAGSSGWDIRELMTYVGWRDIKAAMRYLDGVDVGLKVRFEQGLDQALPAPMPFPSKSAPQLPPLPEEAVTMIEIFILLTPFNAGNRAKAKALREMEKTCLARFQARQIDSDGHSVPTPSARRSGRPSIRFARRTPPDCQRTRVFSRGSVSQSGGRQTLVFGFSMLNQRIS